MYRELCISFVYSRSSFIPLVFFLRNMLAAAAEHSYWVECALRVVRVPNNRHMWKDSLTVYFSLIFRWVVMHTALKAVRCARLSGRLNRSAAFF